MKEIQVYDGDGQPPAKRNTTTKLASKRGVVIINGIYVHYEFGITTDKSCETLAYKFRRIARSRYSNCYGSIIVGVEPNSVPWKYREDTRTRNCFRKDLTRQDVIDLLTPHIIK